MSQLKEYLSIGYLKIESISRAGGKMAGLARHGERGKEEEKEDIGETEKLRGGNDGKIGLGKSQTRCRLSRRLCKSGSPAADRKRKVSESGM